MENEREAVLKKWKKKMNKRKKKIKREPITDEEYRAFQVAKWEDLKRLIRLSGRVRVGGQIYCLGRNVFLGSVKDFLVTHCLPCGLSFDIPADQEKHLTEDHPEDKICRNCMQPWIAATSWQQSCYHVSTVHARFESELVPAPPVPSSGSDSSSSGSAGSGSGVSGSAV